jgi:hypothetical protein
MVTKTDTLGMVRIRFEAGQREAVLRELRDHKSGLLEAMRIHVLHPDKYDDEDDRLTQDKLKTVERALDVAEGTEPGLPFDLVVPIWFAQSLADNGARIAIEELAGTLDALTEGHMPDGQAVGDPRAAVRRAMKEARVWTKALLSAFEYPHQSRRHQ